MDAPRRRRFARSTWRDRDKDEVRARADLDEDEIKLGACDVVHDRIDTVRERPQQSTVCSSCANRCTSVRPISATRWPALTPSLSSNVGGLRIFAAQRSAAGAKLQDDRFAVLAERQPSVCGLHAVQLGERQPGAMLPAQDQLVGLQQRLDLDDALADSRQAARFLAHPVLPLAPRPSPRIPCRHHTPRHRPT